MQQRFPKGTLKRAVTVKRSRALTQYQRDPVAYAADVLGMRLVDSQQQMLCALVDNRRVAVKAHHALGKTVACGVANNWWFDCWERHIAYVTAPSWKQALGLTFKNIKLQRRSKFARTRVQKSKILKTGLICDLDPDLEDVHLIKALNANNGESFQGEHTAPMLITLEESVGVKPYIWEATGGLMTSPECRELAVANPTNEDTDFGQNCRSPLWKTLTFSALEHPNIAAELAAQPPPFPGAVSLVWLMEMLTEECQQVDDAGGDAISYFSLPVLEAALRGQVVPPDAERWNYMPTAGFQGRVLGEFPTQADEQVIPRAWLTHLPVLPLGQMPQIGCDVARKGKDRTSIALRAGPCLLALTEVRQMDTMVVAGRLKELCDEIAPLFRVNPRKIPICIDVTGGLGAGPADRLMELEYNAVCVNSSNKAVMIGRFPNKRSELWWATRERAKDKQLDISRLPADLKERLTRELTTPTWKVDSQGRKVVETKDEIKKRLDGASPDLADAVNLSYCADGASWESVVLSDEDMRKYESSTRGEMERW